MSASAIEGRAEESIPRRIEGVAVSSNDLDAMERFLLDQVDGRTDVASLSDTTMLDVDAVRRVLGHLTTLGLVAYTPPGGAVEPERHPAGGGASGAAPGAAPADDLDIDPVRRARIDHVGAHLATVTFYELLGVAQDADKAIVKRAYFGLSKEFHPDTLHGKRLGTYKSKMEAIFRRITDAHDVITRPKRRAEYDDELARTRRKAFVTVLHPLGTGASREPTEPRFVTEGAAPNGPAQAAPSTQATPGAPPRPAPPAAPGRPAAPPSTPMPSSLRAPSSPGVARPVVASAAGAGPPSAPVPPAPPGPPRAPAPPAAAAPVTAGLRMPTSSVIAPRPPLSPSSSSAGFRPPSSASAPRPESVVAARPATEAGAAFQQRLARDLARQIGHVEPTPARAETRAPPEAQDAAERERSLKRALHGASQLTGPLDRVAQYAKQALALEASGDVPGALSCLRAALQFDSTRADLRATHDRLDRTLAEREAPQSRARAKTDEAAGRFQSASLAWVRVCLGLPNDLEAHLGAARCILEAGHDLRGARDYAQKAADLAPDAIEARLLLVRVFHGAGMKLNAIRELETAAKLDPGNQLVKNLQRELK